MGNKVPSECLTCEDNGPISNDNKDCFMLSGANNPVAKVIHKSLSTENLEDINSKSDLNSVNQGNENLEDTNSNLVLESENSNGLLRNGRKKAILWTREEHQLFLMGLDIYGKGEWKRIAKNYVTTRTPAQVASHAQKYFTRLAASEDQKIRASVFDAPLQLHQPAIVIDGNGEENYIVGSFIPAMPFPYGPMTTMFPYHPGYLYQPQAHGPFPGSSSAAMDQPPEAAQICSSPSATSVDLELRLA